MKRDKGDNQDTVLLIVQGGNLHADNQNLILRNLEDLIRQLEHRYFLLIIDL